jgi:hypothetical protein
VGHVLVYTEIRCILKVCCLQQGRIKFLMVELIYPDLNLRFDMRVIFMTNYFFSVADVPVDSEMILVTDFINLNIKLTQFFRGIHKDRVCACVHRGEYSYVYKYLYLYCVS